MVFQLYGRELAALKSIDAYFVDTEHSRDETVRLYRGLVLVCSGRHNGDWTAFASYRRSQPSSSRPC